ncbi:hypothetical protein CYY_003255 [Polysphondylium violaceum]|uniref:Store-operated calcium entry-associated regulatory factor n=1 Tax=Polysphondylium violaceum TaxID=133409 RepID=A0A8J4PX96_9MYCE|nr:hypothetical protein CYY_003255 [Polysphondylium violaceum]
MIRKSIISIFIILVSITLFSTVISAAPTRAVLLTDVKTITLSHTEMTKSRRTTPIQQLECTGGSAKKEYSLYPKTVQCYNMGSDGTDVQWKCIADLDTTVKLGKIDVSCEGYAYPEDPYILQGSCGLFYELEYTDPVKRASAAEETNYFTVFIWIAIIIFILYIIFKPSDYSTTAPYYNGQPPIPPQPYDPGYPQNGYVNPGGYYNPPPPTAPGCAPAPAANNGPGFWTGAGLGYLFGRSGRSSYYSHTPYYQTPPTFQAPRSSFSSSSRGSGVSSSSSSYGGTSRR